MFVFGLDWKNRHSRIAQDAPGKVGPMDSPENREVAAEITMWRRAGLVLLKAGKRSILKKA